MAEIKHILEQNRAWAKEMLSSDKNVFDRLVGGQDPDFLWIGCSDSRVPAELVTGLAPGELFVHRNVANVFHPFDVNCLAVLQFAVDSLRVEHIIVCGHQGCGGVKAAFEESDGSAIAQWVAPIREVYLTQLAEFEALGELDAQHAKLVDLNVQLQCKWVGQSTIVQDAWARGQSLTIHGWSLRLDNGLLHTVGEPISGPADSGRAR